MPAHLPTGENGHMSKVYQALERAEGQRAKAAPKASPVLDDPREGNANGRGPSDVGEYERLGTAILHARAAAPFKTVMVASPDHGEGTSTVAEGLALTLAERGRLSVLLVDANLRSPAADEMIHAYEAEKQAAELALNGTRKELEVGTRTTLDLLNAERELLAAEVNLIGSQRDRAVTAFQLLAACGKLEPSAIPQ